MRERRLKRRVVKVMASMYGDGNADYTLPHDMTIEHDTTYDAGVSTSRQVLLRGTLTEYKALTILTVQPVYNNALAQYYTTLYRLYNALAQKTLQTAYRVEKTEEVEEGEWERSRIPKMVRYF